MMKFEDGPYYIGGKNRVDEMWACMNNEVVLNDTNINVIVSGISCEVGWYIVLAVFLVVFAVCHNSKVFLCR